MTEEHSTVSFKDVQKALLLCQGSIALSSEALHSSSPDEVVQMLTELGRLDEAIEIGLVLELPSSAYCLARMIKELDSDDKQESALTWRQHNLKHKDNDELIAPYVQKMTANNKVKLCQYLIGQGTTLPKCLVSALSSGPLASQVIASFLCGAENIQFSPDGLHSFVAHDLESCIKSCAATDIHLLLMLVDAVGDYKSTLKIRADQLNSELDQMR